MHCQVVGDFHFFDKAALFIICLAILCLPPPGADVPTGVGDGDGEEGRLKEIEMIAIFTSTMVIWNQPHQNT